MHHYQRDEIQELHFDRGFQIRRCNDHVLHTLDEGFRRPEATRSSLLSAMVVVTFKLPMVLRLVHSSSNCDLNSFGDRCRRHRFAVGFTKRRDGSSRSRSSGCSGSLLPVSMSNQGHVCPSVEARPIAACVDRPGSCRLVLELVLLNSIRVFYQQQCLN
jgi:hypothetical protein